MTFIKVDCLLQSQDGHDLFHLIPLNLAFYYVTHARELPLPATDVISSAQMNNGSHEYIFFVKISFTSLDTPASGSNGHYLTG